MEEKREQVELDQDGNEEVVIKCEAPVARVLRKPVCKNTYI